MNGAERWTPVELGHRPLGDHDPTTHLSEAYFFGDGKGASPGEQTEWWLVLRDGGAATKPGAFVSLGRPALPPPTDVIDQILAEHGFGSSFGGWRHAAGSEHWSSRIASLKSIRAAEQREASRKVEIAHDESRILFGVVVALAVVAGGMSLGALLPLPDAYYAGMRWILPLCAVAATLLVANRGRAVWGFGLVPIALVWNPFVPLHLSRVQWVPLNLIATGFCAALGYAMGRASAHHGLRAEEARRAAP